MKYRIPAAGDNQPSRELLADGLAAEATDVVAAANLEQAFAVFRGHPSLRPAGRSIGPQVGLSLAMWVREKPEFSSYSGDSGHRKCNRDRDTGQFG